MRILPLHAKACALLVCLALLFANTAGAIGMVSGNHAAMESKSSHSKHSSSMTSIAHDHSDHMTVRATANHSADESELDCMDHSSCVAECAAHCATSAFIGGQTLAATLFMALNVPEVNHLPKSAVNSALFKPPRNLH